MSDAAIAIGSASILLALIAFLHLAPLLIVLTAAAVAIEMALFHLSICIDSYFRCSCHRNGQKKCCSCDRQCKHPSCSIAFLHLAQLLTVLTIAAVAIEMATKDNVDWLLHIDTDELMYPGGSASFSLQDVLATFPEDVDTVVFPNYESLPESNRVHDPFTEVSTDKALEINPFTKFW